MRAWPAIAVALGILAAGSAASAQERLVLEPYPGGAWYDVVNQSGPGGFVREQMPKGQTLQNAHDVLTAQSNRGYRGTPADYINLAFSQLSQACETVETVGPTIAVEADRPVAYGRFYCGKQKGQAYGAHVFFKAIKGSEGLYIIDRDFRIPASEHPSAPALPADEVVTFLQTEAEARKYLTDKVYICDPVIPEARCASEAVPTGK
jgi:hypothetical protein